MEYGDLVHIIWDFQKLEAGSLNLFDAYMKQYFPDEQVYNGEEYITVTALQRFAQYIDIKAAQTELVLSETKSVFQQTAQQLQETNQFDSAVDTTRLIYGFMNGAIDVFPYDSLPDLCRDNVTTTKDHINNLFIDSPYIYPEDELEAVTSFSELLANPYGLTFSCLFGA